MRDGSRVGHIIKRPTLRDGFVKANGAVLTASEYPRLLHYAQDNSLVVTAAVYATDCSKYVYDSAAGTLQIPNMTGRVLQGGDTVKSMDAGLPNITGIFNVDMAAGSGDNKLFTVSNNRTRASADDGYYGNTRFTFDASKSNAIYGASTTVQPPALQLIPQIKY